ncbi:hypothetical protein JDW14_04470 [Tuanshanicoccus yangjingiae]|nr:hypothetical protein [Facklamia sp. 252]NEW67100.1 hypothetical protein [Facklamia sp. 253]QQD66355.1 hypothetical protein JDW14_04470 [Aerococcaceae bacterium zg-252]
MVYDGATWHKSKILVIPENIGITRIPPYTSERNPIEHIWNKYELWDIKMNVLTR